MSATTSQAEESRILGMNAGQTVEEKATALEAQGYQCIKDPWPYEKFSKTYIFSEAYGTETMTIQGRRPVETNNDRMCFKESFEAKLQEGNQVYALLIECALMEPDASKAPLAKHKVIQYRDCSESIGKLINNSLIKEPIQIDQSNTLAIPCKHFGGCNFTREMLFSLMVKEYEAELVQTPNSGWVLHFKDGDIMALNQDLDIFWGMGNYPQGFKLR